MIPDPDEHRNDKIALWLLAAALAFAAIASWLRP
jgi:hypothetical protein